MKPNKNTITVIRRKLKEDCKAAGFSDVMQPTNMPRQPAGEPNMLVLNEKEITSSRTEQLTPKHMELQKGSDNETMALGIHFSSQKDQSVVNDCSPIEHSQHTREQSPNDYTKAKENWHKGSFKARSMSKREKMFSLKIAQELAVQGIGQSHVPPARPNFIFIPKRHSYDDALKTTETERKQ